MVRAMTAAALALWWCAAAPGQEARERKNIDQLTPQELAAYKHAVGKLQSSTDPNANYVFHANLHNLFLFNPPHGCEHGNDLFFPWHRYHLAHFEKALQAADPDHPTLSTKNVTIPYWDWTKQASGQRFPKAFENALDDGARPNPLYNDFRNTAPASPTFDEAYMTAVVRNNAHWNQFAGGPKDVNEFYGAFESPSHNDMHSLYIGGTMGFPDEAALDPIYWSFHAFIDLTWDRWQKVHNKPPTSQNKVLRGFPGAPTVAATVDVRQLGYFYTHTPESIAPAPPMLEAALTPRVVPLPSPLPGAERAVAVWGGEGPFKFQLPAPVPAFRRADLWFDQVRIPQSLSYRAEVFIHPIDRAYQPADAAGFLSVWQGHPAAGGHGHHTHGNLFLTVTGPLRRAAAAHAGKELVITIVPKAVARAARPRAALKPTAAAADEIQFKGVRLVLDGGGPFRQATNQGTNHGH